MAKRRTPKNWDDSAIENVNAYGHYLQRLYELSISMFEWEGLPDTCDPRYLEVALFWDGWAIGFEDEVMGPLTLRCARFLRCVWGPGPERGVWLQRIQKAKPRPHQQCYNL